MSTSSGTLTFLFTDVVGHTQLWDADPEAMAVAMRDHDAYLADAAASGGGTVVKSTGDGVMVVFPDAGRAVDVAVGLQRHFAEREWPNVGRLELRVGLHSGVADERDRDYFGPDVIRAARLCDAGHGGQVLASRAVVELAGEHQWVPLGSHQLNGLRAPLEIHQIVAEGLLETFPALRTATARADDLPSYRSAFFGRASERAELIGLLDEHRLITLTGIGGTGKTRLAVEVAREVLDRFTDGTYFVDLSVVTDATRVWDALASAMKLASAAGPGSSTTSRDAAVSYLANRQALLVLDNCEHLLDAAADLVDDVLGSTTDVVVLATSREGLHVDGERLVQVSSLPADSAGLELLEDRVAAGGPVRIDRDVGVRICERLDGLPLGIELVAAQCRQLGAAEVAGRLSDRFRLVTGSRRRVSRQRTLEATLEWSHDLLGEQERTLLRRMSVFTGGASLSAIETITDATAQVVAALVDKSLVERRDDGRFHMLETVRAYAEDRLVEADEADATRRALADWMLGHLESQPPEELYFSTTSELLDFVTEELENLYACLDWASDQRDQELVIRLATPAALAMWEAADATLRPIMQHVRVCLDDGIDGDLRHAALAAAMTSGWVIGDTGRRAVVVVSEVEEHRTDALAVIRLCHASFYLDSFGRLTGDQDVIENAARLLDRADVISAGAVSDIPVLPNQYRAICAMNAGDWHRAFGLFEEATRASSRAPRFFVWHTHAVAALGAGRPFDRPDEALVGEWAPAAAHLPGTIYIYIDAACRDDPDRPRRPRSIDRRDLDRFVFGGSIWIRNLLICTGQLAAREGDWPTAATLLAIAQHAPGVTTFFGDPACVALHGLTVSELRVALPRTERHDLLADARTKDLSAGLDLAVAWLATDPPSVDAAS